MPKESQVVPAPSEKPSGPGPGRPDESVSSESSERFVNKPAPHHDPVPVNKPGTWAQPAQSSPVNKLPTPDKFEGDIEGLYSKEMMEKNNSKNSNGGLISTVPKGQFKSPNFKSPMGTWSKKVKGHFSKRREFTKVKTLRKWMSGQLDTLELEAEAKRLAAVDQEATMATRFRFNENAKAIFQEFNERNNLSRRDSAGVVIATSSSEENREKTKITSVTDDSVKTDEKKLLGDRIATNNRATTNERELLGEYPVRSPVRGSNTTMMSTIQEMSTQEVADKLGLKHYQEATFCMPYNHLLKPDFHRELNREFATLTDDTNEPPTDNWGYFKNELLTYMPPIFIMYFSGLIIACIPGFGHPRAGLIERLTVTAAYYFWGVTSTVLALASVLDINKYTWPTFRYQAFRNVIGFVLFSLHLELDGHEEKKHANYVTRCAVTLLLCQSWFATYRVWMETPTGSKIDAEKCYLFTKVFHFPKYLINRCAWTYVAVAPVMCTALISPTYALRVDLWVLQAPDAPEVFGEIRSVFWPIWRLLALKVLKRAVDVLDMPPMRIHAVIIFEVVNSLVLPIAVGQSRDWGEFISFSAVQFLVGIYKITLASPIFIDESRFSGLFWQTLRSKASRVKPPHGMKIFSYRMLVANMHSRIATFSAAGAALIYPIAVFLKEQSPKECQKDPVMVSYWKGGTRKCLLTGGADDVLVLSKYPNGPEECHLALLHDMIWVKGGLTQVFLVIYFLEELAMDILAHYVCRKTLGDKYGKFTKFIGVWNHPNTRNTLIRWYFPVIGFFGIVLMIASVAQLEGKGPFAAQDDCIK